MMTIGAVFAQLFIFPSELTTAFNLSLSSTAKNLHGWPLLAALAGALIAYQIGVWAKPGPAILDLITLAGGLLAGALVLSSLKKRDRTGEFLKSLQTTIYIPSVPANICGSGTTEKNSQ